MKNKFNTLQISKKEQSKITGGAMPNGQVVCTYSTYPGGLVDVYYSNWAEGQAACSSNGDCLGCDVI